MGFLVTYWGYELQAKLVTLLYSRTWPTTIICERQAFTLNRINSVPSLTISHASLLSWSLAPELADPETYSTHFRIPNLEAEIEKILDRSEYSGNVNKLLLAIAPNCTQFILECKVGPTTYTGTFSQPYDKLPFFTFVNMKKWSLTVFQTLLDWRKNALLVISWNHNAEK